MSHTKLLDKGTPIPLPYSNDTMFPYLIYWSYFLTQKKLFLQNIKNIYWKKHAKKAVDII